MRSKKALSHDSMLFLEELPLSNPSEDLLDYNSICKAALQQLSGKKQFVRQWGISDYLSLPTFIKI